MQQALLIGLGVVAVGIVAGWIFSPHAPRLAWVCQFGAKTLLHLLATLALVWVIKRLLEDPDALHIALALVLSLIALETLLYTALMGYILVKGRNHTP